MRLYQTLTLACTSLMISACASVAPVRDANNVNDKVRFNMDGRFSVQYVEKNTDKNLTGKMQWEETGRATDIILASPIGTAMASLHVTRNEAVLKTSSGEMYSEKTPEELLYRALGYELPFSNLRQMVGTANQPLADALSIDGWDVKILQRFNNYNNLAKKLLISRQDPTPVTMTLFIDERSDAPDSK
jgi:outer membrane biogenesis lipoprotein LolB